MASFTDIIPKFNPYVQQLPVEAMVQVGMEKQKRYDEGIQKIQAQIDQIGGLSILRPQDKQYLQSKLNELGNNLKGVAAGDFSNFQLVNSVGGMIGQISKDPFVIAAVKSTAQDQKNFEQIEADKKAGKLSPDNEYNYLKQRQKYFDAGLKDESGNPITFSGSYIPHFDIWKFAKETFDAVKPDQYSFDQIFQLGPDGKPIVTEVKNEKTGKMEKSFVYSTTMTRLDKEGRFPKKVQETLSQVFSDPRVSQQLRITGEYNYKNYDEDALVSKLSTQKEDLLNIYNESLASLNIRKNAGEDVQDDIDAVKQAISNVNTNYDAYKNSVRTNPDATRGKLYEDDVRTRYTTMFGYIKNDQKVLENPAWRASFEVQKEANAQSRWAQTENRERQQYRDEQDYKNKKLKQDWDIAVLNATTKGGKSAGKGLGIPEDTSRFTQANQFADTDVIYLEDKDYRDAADNFSKNSIQIVWRNAGFNDIPENVTRLKALMDSGKSEEEAKYKIFEELAEKQKISVEDFIYQYSDRVVKTYNKLTPEQKEKLPVLTDQYNAFVKSKKSFDDQRTIRKEIESQVEKIYGTTLAKESALKNVKEQTIRYNGTDYKLTKDDIYDLALYLKGNLSVVGGGYLDVAGDIDEGVRNAARSAAGRIRARGKEPLLSAILNDNFMRRAYRGGPITAVASSLGQIKDAYRVIRHPGDTDNPFNQVESVFNVIDNEKFAGVLKAKAEIIKKNYSIQPNLRTPLFTGDSDTDKQLLYTLKNKAGGYSIKGGGKTNASPDFKDFAEALASAKSPDEVTVSAQPTIDAEGNVAVEMVIYNKTDLSRAGGMTIQTDEALAMGIDINTLYESKEISILRNKIKYNKGRTSGGDPSEVGTYIQGDAYYDDMDFAGLKNSGFSAKGNVVLSNGVYYPYIYVTDGTNETVRELPGSPSLGSAVSALLTVNPTFANMILNEKKK